MDLTIESESAVLTEGEVGVVDAVSVVEGVDAAKKVAGRFQMTEE